MHTYLLKWKNVTVEVTHTPEEFSAMDFAYDHLGIKSIQPERCPLPITETGYKSHWIPSGHLTNQQDVIDYVQQWLEHEDKGQADQMTLL